MIWLILILGFSLRLFSLNQSLWLDEAINVLATQNYSFWGMLTEYAKGDFHPPAYFVISWFWNQIFGTSEIAIRIPSVIFGLLTIFVIYLIGEKLHSKKLGLLAALLLAINPLHIYYSQEARMYSLAALAVSINIFLFIKLFKKEKVGLISLILSNILILLTDYVAYFIFPAELLIIMLTGKIATPRLKAGFAMRWSSGLLLAGLFSIWWMPTFLSQLNIGSVASANLPAWKFIVGSFDFKAIPLTLVKFIIGKVSLENKILYLILFTPVVAFFLFLIYKGAKNLKEFDKKFLTSWLIVPIALASFISIFIPIYNYFRVIYTLPAFLLLVAFGILSFKPVFRYTFLTIVSVIFLSCSLIYLTNPKFQREDWKGLVRYLTSQGGDTKVLFESSGTLPPFDYYNMGVLEAKGALKDFPVKSESGLADIRGYISQSENVYLVDYLVEITDKDRLVAKKLKDLRYELVETKDFIGVGFVYRYAKNE